MKAKRFDILVIIVAALTLMNCSKNDLLTSFEEEQEQSMSSLPLQFTPYVESSTEATTRADLNYLSNISDSDGSNKLGNFKQFPWYSPDPNDPNDPDKGTGSAVGARGNYRDYRFGKLGNNSYIVGLYGYHGMEGETQLDWDAMKNNINLTSNFMTNQPLLHTAGKPNTGNASYTDIWEYSPLKYWPNSTGNNAKVTFISYYPFQDYPESGRGYNPTTGVTGYYRDGRNADGEIDGRYVDFSDCIVPPAKDAKGADAYTFTFTQKTNLKEQIDFLLGINQNVTKQKVDGSPSIDLNLKHTLCAVAFDLRAPAFSLPANTTVEYEINSISLEGLYAQGKVYPVVNGNSFDIQWKELEGNTSYTLEFNDSSNFYDKFEKPSFNGAERRYSRQVIYENSYYKGSNIEVTESVSNNQSNSRGMKYLMLVIPQKVEVDKNGELKDAFLTINYNITYNYGGDIVNVFKNNEERIKLKDSEKHSGGDKSQMFIAGKFLTFNIRFLGPKQIEMDAVVTDWDDIEEYEMSTDPVDDEDEGGGDQQGGDPEP